MSRSSGSTPPPAPVAARRTAPFRRRSRPAGARIGRGRGHVPGPLAPRGQLIRDQQLQLLDQRLQAAFALAADAGELDEPLQPPMLFALVLGPLIFRATLQDGTVPDTLLERLIGAAAKWR